jgi:hypothetical protein
LSTVIANVAIASFIWAAPFVALGVYWMCRARKANELGIAGFAGIALVTGLLLFFVGSVGFLIIFRNQPGPDAGLAISVGLAFSLVGAAILWAFSMLMAFAILRTRPLPPT